MCYLTQLVFQHGTKALNSWLCVQLHQYNSTVAALLVYTSIQTGCLRYSSWTGIPLFSQHELSEFMLNLVKPLCNLGKVLFLGRKLKEVKSFQFLKTNLLFTSVRLLILRGEIMLLYSVIHCKETFCYTISILYDTVIPVYIMKMKDFLCHFCCCNHRIQ
jgi:hypothetical protein